jgi:uncharacterized membrane protein
MLMEIFILILAVASFFLLWGYKARQPTVFILGCVFIIANAMIIYGTGLQTDNVGTITNVKDPITGTYTASIAYNSVYIDSDFALWATTWAMLIIGIVMIPASLYLLPKVQRSTAYG